MPDQNNPTDVSPTIPPAPMDIPPADASIPPPFPPDAGSAAPSFDIPPVITPSQPKKKFGGKRVIATILGLLVLVGGLGAGVILVRQQQDIREKAATDQGGGSCISAGQCLPSGRTCCSGLNTISVSENNCSSRKMCQTTTVSCNSGNCYNDCLCRGNSATECRAACPTATTTPTCNSGNCYNDCLCRGNSATECRAACPTATASPTAQTCRSGWLSGGTNRDAAEEACIGQCGYRNVAAREGNCTWENRGISTLPNWCYQCVGTGATSTPTQPPPPDGGPTAQCLNVKAYDTDWNELSTSQLSSFKAGDVVRFTVAGTATSGSFDKAKFKINGVQRPEVTQKKPGADEFYDEYTIPPGVTSFSIGAQIHHTTLGWSE